MRTSHIGQTENWLLLKCFNGKIWPLRCFSRKIDSFYRCVTNEKARNTLVILKKWQTSVLCVCKKGLGKVKNRNTLVFISNAIDHVEKCSFAPTAPDRSHWRSLWHLALRHLTVWRSVHFQTPVLSVERQGPPRLSIREGGRERGGERHSVVRLTSTEDGCTSNHPPGEEKNSGGLLTSRHLSSAWRGGTSSIVH